MRPVAGFPPVGNKGVAEGRDMGNQRQAGGRAGAALAQEAAWCLLIREIGGRGGEHGDVATHPQAEFLFNETSLCRGVSEP